MVVKRAFFNKKKIVLSILRNNKGTIDNVKTEYNKENKSYKQGKVKVAFTLLLYTANLKICSNLKKWKNLTKCVLPELVLKIRYLFIMACSIEPTKGNINILVIIAFGL